MKPVTSGVAKTITFLTSQAYRATRSPSFAKTGSTLWQDSRALPTPMTWKPKRGAVQSYEKVKSQAFIQFEARETGGRRYELLSVQPPFGLCTLPEPSAGDIFFDLEGDPFVGEHGLEYLFGYHFRDEYGKAVYRADWSFNQSEEKAAFERFVDFAIERRKAYPGLHIYHFAPYEPAALKTSDGPLCIA